MKALLLTFLTLTQLAFADCQDTKMLYSSQYEASTGRFDVVVFQSQWGVKENPGSMNPWLDRAQITIAKKPVRFPEAIRQALNKYRQDFSKLKAPQNANAAVIKNLQKKDGVARVFDASKSGLIFQGLANECDAEQLGALTAGYVKTLSLDAKDAWKTIHKLATTAENQVFEIMSDIHYDDVSGREFHRVLEYKLTLKFSNEVLAQEKEVGAGDLFELLSWEISRDLTKAKYTLSDHLYRALTASDHLDCIKELKLD